MSTITIELPDEMLSDVQRFAKEYDLSEAEFIREAISRYVELLKRPLPSFVGGVSVEGVIGADSKDWLMGN